MSSRFPHSGLWPDGTLAPRPFIGVIADDLAGAVETGECFARYGYTVRLFSTAADPHTVPHRLAGRRTDVVVLNTDSRTDSPDAARITVLLAAGALRRAGCELFYMSTRPGLSATAGAAFDALLDELDQEFGVVVLAAPDLGHTTVDGCQHGTDLVEQFNRQSRRRVGLIDLAAMRSGEVAEALAEARAQGVGCAICDAESREDLAAIAAAVARERAMLACPALAAELPGCWTAPRPFDPLNGLDLAPTGGALALTVAGDAQGQALAESAAAVVAVDDPARAAELVQTITAALAANGLVVLQAASDDYLELTAYLAAQVVEGGHCHRLLTAGEALSAAADRRLGLTELIVLPPLAPGVTALLAPGAPPLLWVPLPAGPDAPRAAEALTQFGAAAT